MPNEHMTVKKDCSGASMQTWKFNTDTIAASEQHAAWCTAMGRLNLPVGTIAKSSEFFGAVSCLVSPLGIEFARVDSAAQEIAGRYPKQESAIWLSLLLEGKATLIDDEKHIDLEPGDLLFGPTGVPARLVFSTPFQQLFIKVPHVAISPRLLAPLSLPLGYLPGQNGVNHIFSNMLSALASSLDDLRAEQLRPIELSLTEFLLTCLTGQESTPLIGCGPKARSSHLHSICQTIEALLSDPELSPAMIAAEHGVSLRYLQKLFAQSNNTFSNYVRLRRLERCRNDLTSPIYAQMSVTEICFRWGFNGSAHFSRTFRSQYGMPPRDYRRQAIGIE